MMQTVPRQILCKPPDIYDHTYLLNDSEQVFVFVHVEDELAPYAGLSQQLSMVGDDTVEDTYVPSVSINQK
jgi:hypothetical protein